MRPNPSGVQLAVGILSWGVYLPTWRLRREVIAEALGVPAGRGTRSVASFDEDTTTMAVEAGRIALRAHHAERPATLFFATPAPGYLDKTNASIVHDALDLAPGGAYDAAGSSRSSVGALLGALGVASMSSAPAMMIAADLRTGLAGSADERDSGDGAISLTLGSGEDVVAEFVASGSSTAEFLDRWRAPGEVASHTWEERFGEEAYGPLVADAWEAALRGVGVDPSDVDHVIVSGLHARAVRAAAGLLGTRPDALVADRVASVGNLGAAQPLVMLAEALETAAPGALVAVVSLADGVDVVLWRLTDALEGARTRRRSLGVPSVEETIRSGRDDLPYTRFLTWRGHLHRDPPRRPDPERPGAPTMWRSSAWRSGFSASRCRDCGFRHLPPTRVCLQCHSVDRMELERLSEVAGRVATFTVDHLAASPSPPVVGVVVDFDGGGRYRLQMTDVDPAALEIGMPVEMTFRRLDSALGVHNYFWKARPASAARS